MQSPYRTAAAGLIGNVLEWFDFAVYGYFATRHRQAVLPGDRATTAQQLLAFAVFSLGFVARPIGSLVLGLVGDRIGRRALLTLSIALMGGATLVHRPAADVQTIGVAAPILLVADARWSRASRSAASSPARWSTRPSSRRRSMRGIIAQLDRRGHDARLHPRLGDRVARQRARSVPRQPAAWGWRIPFIGSVVFVRRSAGCCAAASTSPSKAEGGRRARTDPPIARRRLAADPADVRHRRDDERGVLPAFTFAVERRKAEEQRRSSWRTRSACVVVLFAKLFGGWLSDRVGRRRMMIGLTVVMMAAALLRRCDFMLHGSPAQFMLGSAPAGSPARHGARPPGRDGRRDLSAAHARDLDELRVQHHAGARRRLAAARLDVADRQASATRLRRRST